MKNNSYEKNVGKNVLYSEKNNTILANSVAEIVRTDVSTVTKMYRHYKFNGTVFVISILARFRYCIVTQVEINQYVTKQFATRYQLETYVTPPPAADNV